MVSAFWIDCMCGLIISSKRVEYHHKQDIENSDKGCHFANNFTVTLNLAAMRGSANERALKWRRGFQ